MDLDIFDSHNKCLLSKGKYPFLPKTYFESVPPSYQPKAKEIMLEKKFKEESFMIFEEEQCPPYEIVAVGLGKRLVFKCRKCQKSEEEI